MLIHRVACLAVLATCVTTLSPVAFAASGVVVSKSVEIKGKSPDELLKVFGGFCAIQQWHPAVAKCDEAKEGNDTFRTLTLKDGAKIKEKRTGTVENGYSYKIIESPLPVKDYLATFSIKKDGEVTIVNWLASFQAKDKPESEAKAVIEGIFDAGLKSIADMAAK